MPDTQIDPSDLVIHILNVGFGDAILLELPADGGKRRLAVVDCYNGSKVIPYINKVISARGNDNVEDGLAFLCATHPHGDHISGMTALLDENHLQPDEFWDSGFRHKSNTYKKILKKLKGKKIPVVRVSSGMEWYHGKLRITALAPSVLLRNRYATYGIDINNSSIVLRLEYHKDSVLEVEGRRYEGKRDPALERKAGKKVVILGADAELYSWSRISEEFPRLEKTGEHEGAIKTKVINMLGCSVIKVSHHGSMHSIPLDIYERISPALAVISTKQEESEATVRETTLTRKMFPHSLASTSLAEVGARVITTDGDFEGEQVDGDLRDAGNAHEGSVVIVVPPSGGGPIRWRKLEDDDKNAPQDIPKTTDDSTWTTIS